MRYNQIRLLDMSNGHGIGIALFVQGCHFHCKDCFNQETWDFNSGKEWTKETAKEFLRFANRTYIKRVSILGGEPLAEENLDSVLKLLKEIRILFKNKKTVWLYTGFTWNEIYGNDSPEFLKRQKIIELCDVLVDGRFECDKKDLSLPFRGSTNQRLIDVKKTMCNGEVILWQ